MKSRPIILAAALACATSAFGPGVGPSAASEPCVKAVAQQRSVDDRRTSDEIRRRIESDDTVSALAHQVKVETNEGIVTLRGPVDSSEERMVLASLAESVPGVRRVDDHLEVRR